MKVNKLNTLVGISMLVGIIILIKERRRNYEK